MEKKKKTNRVKASVKGRKPIGLLESSVRKRETVASRGREFSHFFPFQQPAPLRRGESSTTAQTTARFRLSTLTFLLLLRRRSMETKYPNKWLTSVYLMGLYHLQRSLRRWWAIEGNARAERKRDVFLSFFFAWSHAQFFHIFVFVF